MNGLLRSEYLKVITTKVWWAMMIGLVGAVGVALLVNWAIAKSPKTSDHHPTAYYAANLYTSGQYFGVLLAAIIGTLMVTNEFRHQTATSTFLVTPKRINVILAKLVVGLGWGIAYGLVCTVISIPVGASILSGLNKSASLGDGDVIKAILLNLIAFGVWAILGIGVGTLLQNQIGAVVALLVTYFVTNLGGTILIALGDAWHMKWLGNVYYYLPYGATQAMTSADKIAEHAPPWWGGMLMVLLYGAAAIFSGTWLTTRRDIS